MDHLLSMEKVSNILLFIFLLGFERIFLSIIIVL